jgi:GT2 family glycosyltransferase
MRIEQKELSIVIVTYNSALSITECLSSLKKCSSGPVIVIDNASSDCSVQIARAAGVEVHELGQNYGFAYAANYGACVAQTTFLCFLNPDCICDVSLLETAAETLLKTKRCVAVPDFIHDGGQIVKGCQPGYTWIKLLADCIENNRNWPRFVNILKCLPGYNSKQWQWPLCACAFTSTDFFIEVGGFDKDYFIYMEDVELGHAIYRLGGTIESLETKVYHHAHTGSTISAERRMMLLNRSRLQYARKHYGALYEGALRMLINKRIGFLMEP